MPQKRKPYSSLSKSGKYYRDNPKAAAKKNKKSAASSVTKSGLKSRAAHKRRRRAAEKKYGKAAIKGKDIEKSTGKPVSVKKNRGSKTATAGDRRARGKKKRR